MSRITLNQSTGRDTGRQAGNQWQQKDVEGENILRRNREQSRKGNAKV
jgi:hypothetical protein